VKLFSTYRISMHDLPTPELPIMSILSNCESLNLGSDTCLVCYTAYLNIMNSQKLWEVIDELKY
jgi:hypothetical protein